MKWFGETQQPGACDDPLHERVAVPVGQLCAWCDERIEAHHRGVVIPMIETVVVNRELPYHIECFIRSIVGSVGHQMHVCSCYGGDAGDMEGHTKRQAAIAAYSLFTNRQENWLRDA